MDQRGTENGRMIVIVINFIIDQIAETSQQLTEYGAGNSCGIWNPVVLVTGPSPNDPMNLMSSEAKT